MNETTGLKDEELYTAGLAALQRELGLVGMVRFLQLAGACQGDYTAERQQWVKSLTVEEIIEDVQKLREKKAVERK